ncbi:hypothetical protein [Pluralibacter gergoviae]
MSEQQTACTPDNRDQ